MRVRINGWFHPKTGTGTAQYLTGLMSGFMTIGEERRPNLFLSLPSHSIFGERFDKLWFEQVLFPLACRRGKVDLAHVPHFAPPLFPTVPTVVTVHDLIPFLFPEYGNKLRVRLYNWLISRALKKAETIIAVSQWTKSDLVKHLRLPEGRITVIYEAAGEEYRPVTTAEKDIVKKKYGLPEEYLLYLGGVDRRKNLGFLFHALALLEDDSSPPLMVAGRVPLRDNLLFPNPRRLAEQAGISDKIHFLGWVAEEDKPALYSAATIFLHPSLYEGFGLPPLEAMACGSPVIVSNSSSFSEVVGSGGILLDPQDAQAWASSIHRLLGDREERLEWGRKGREQSARFSWRKTAEETLAVYQRIAP